MMRNVRVSLNVDEDVWRALRHDAVDKDVTEREIIERLIAKKYAKSAARDGVGEHHEDAEHQGY